MKTKHENPKRLFLHSHPVKEGHCNIDKDHVIVDFKDWESVQENLVKKGINPEAVPDMLSALQDIVGQAEKTRLGMSPDLSDSINVFAKNAIKKATA